MGSATDHGLAPMATTCRRFGANHQGRRGAARIAKFIVARYLPTRIPGVAPLFPTPLFIPNLNQQPSPQLRGLRELRGEPDARRRPRLRSQPPGYAHRLSSPPKFTIGRFARFAGPLQCFDPPLQRREPG